MSRVYATVLSRHHHLIRKSDGVYDSLEYEYHPKMYTSHFRTSVSLPFPSATTSSAGSPVPAAQLRVVTPLAQPPCSTSEARADWLTCPWLSPRGGRAGSCGASMFSCYKTQAIVAPYTTCLINGIYWDPQTPRLLRRLDAQRLLRHVKPSAAATEGWPELPHNCSRMPPGPLKKRTSHLKSEIEQAEIMKKSGMKRVLLLGSGYVSGPVIEYLTRDIGTQVTVASVLLTQAEELAGKYPNTIPVMLDVTSQEGQLESLVKDHDLVISMLPYGYHPVIAKHCINKKVNMVTASYLSPAMKDLQQSAEEAGITIVNEMGLDPGIDHMLAMECIDQAKADGCTIESYSSFCGGLPAPECSDNPLRYKFSWSPYGVLLNTISPAIFLKDNKVVSIPAGGTLMESTAPMDFMPGFNLEGFPNRDSTKYAEQYGIESAHTLIRGTLRFKGFSKAMSGFVKLGLINTDPCPMKEMLCIQMGLPLSTNDEAFEGALKKQTEQGFVSGCTFTMQKTSRL
ncbi:unnamed protein product [Coregonus sp. 'balchen']|nr:unnamed protein product [Coregonus sp. 'balchen']